MKYKVKLLYIGLLVFGFIGCFEPEDYPEVPEILMENVRFVDSNSGSDSLIITFSFKDKSGDIGLNSGDIFTPYQVYNFIIDAEDTVVSISGSGYALPLYSAPVFISEQDGDVIYFYDPSIKRFFSETDNRPSYDCDNYEIIGLDTIYIESNEFFNNIHVALERKVGDEFREFTPEDFRRIFNSQDCSLGDFDGRIPLFDANGKTGTISYSLISQGWQALREEELRVRIYVYDRALNRSNETVSDSFVIFNLSQ